MVEPNYRTKRNKDRLFLLPTASLATFSNANGLTEACLENDLNYAVEDFSTCRSEGKNYCVCKQQVSGWPLPLHHRHNEIEHSVLLIPDRL